MIIAWTTFIVALIFVAFAIIIFVNCMQSNKCQSWDYRGFLVSTFIAACAAQYIWG